MAKDTAAGPAPVTIKKYANRRLYNTATSSYVTLDYLSRMVKDGIDFVVYDAKSGDDITRSVLTQIIVEEESKGHHLLPISFLRQLIGMYGDNLQWMVPNYLESAMQAFARNQDQVRQYFQQTMSGMFPFGPFEEMSKQQMAMVERAMRMFSPFPDAGGPDAGDPDAAGKELGGEDDGGKAGTGKVGPGKAGRPGKAGADTAAADNTAANSSLADRSTVEAAAEKAAAELMAAGGDPSVAEQQVEALQKRLEELQQKLAELRAEEERSS